MVFSNLLFLFLFFTTSLIVYYFIKPKYRNYVLLVFSLIFYSWAGPRYLVLLLADTFICWLMGVCIKKFPKYKVLFLIIACLFLLGILGYFKYSTFVLTNVQMIFGIPKEVRNIVLPIGISFYTFQLLSYVVDVYWNKVEAQMHFWKLLLYSSLFHQCIAGPIVRYETVSNDIDHRSVKLNDVYEGVRRFSIGLAKKAILANSCAAVADTLFENLQTQSMIGLWLGMVFFTLQIYLDFSAYSDMAIGMGRMIGFHYLENFNYPYMAKSVQDFWRRWHISLSSFFRDYVYIPLGGSRGSKFKYVRNIFVVWFLTGLWHGASWNYILWGLYYFVFLMLEKFVIQDNMPKGINHLYTLFVVLIGWTIFKFEDLHDLSTVLAGMIGFTKGGFIGLQVKTLFTGNIFLLLFSIIACTNVFKIFRMACINIGKMNIIAFYIVNIIDNLIIPLCLILSILALMGNTYNPFLYFQF